MARDLVPLHFAELADSAASAIGRHCGDRLRDVSAGVVDDTIVVRGRAESYYGVQLAIEAARAWLLKWDQSAVNFDMLVENRVGAVRDDNPAAGNRVRLTVSV